ncbi:MAG: hypothetical protein ABIH23_31940 [bacterium]
MADMNPTQADADALIAMEKHRVDASMYSYPMPGDSLSVPLVSADKRESFILDIGRGRIDLMKVSYQNRARQIVSLVRLDLGGKPHRNPDGVEIGCPHLHMYREDYGDKWAAPAPTDKFPNMVDTQETMEHFMAFCNITIQPRIQRGLF